MKSADKTATETKSDELAADRAIQDAAIKKGLALRNRRIMSGMRCTDRQWAYLKILMHEAFAKRYKKTPPLDVHHQPRIYSSKQASADIKSLLEAKALGWPK